MLKIKHTNNFIHEEIYLGIKLKLSPHFKKKFRFLLGISTLKQEKHIYL